MNETTATPDANTPRWFAIRTRQIFKAEQALAPLCHQVFLPKEYTTTGKSKRPKAIIPHVMFVCTTHTHILELEAQGKKSPQAYPPFWIYRYPTDNKIQEIPPQAINLIRLLTARDTTKCEIYRSDADFKEHQHVRITGGPFEGYTGHVVRVKKNKHVVVKIEGICLILLPYIHPDLLQPIN